MKKLLLILGSVMLAVNLGAVGAFAQSAGSFAGDFRGTELIPLVTCSATDVNSCTSSNSGFLSATIKMPTGKSLLLMGSLETALYTSTTAASKGGTKSTASGTGSIIVTPVVTDSNGYNYSVYPNKVTYNERTQTLSATFDGTNCTADALTGVVTCTDPEVVSLLLSTMSAHTFNFLVPNLPQGTYTVNFNVAVSTTGSSDSVGSGVTVKAGVGASSLGVLVVQTQTPFDSLNFVNPD